jgi:hypothetical protein
MTNTRSPGRTRKTPILGAVVLAGLMLLTLPAGLASASSAPANAPAQTLWAYGAVQTVLFSGDSLSGWWDYSGSATYGYSVILNQTNLSATSIELTANRTMGAEFQIQYCHPNCKNPVFYGNETDHLYETIAASAILSTNGEVMENGVPVSALALNSSESSLHANLTESGASYRPIAGIIGERSHYLAANVVASSTVTFAPGLGILPTVLSAGQSWNSSSQFTAHESAAYEYYGAARGPLASGKIGPVNGNFSIPANGTVALYGTYAPSNTVVLGGVTYPEVALRVVGPFTVREGFILVPSATDLFGGGTQPWGPQENGSATATMSYLDARAVEGRHLGIGASQWVYDSSTIDPNSTNSVLPGTSGISAAESAVTEGAPATTVQGVPETVATAQSQQGCLVFGSGCPTGSPSPAGLHGLVGLLAVGVVVILIVAVVVLVSERRRMPPPAYPNAALYPPGNSPLSGRGAPGAPPPPAEDDPLQNLW